MHNCHHLNVVIKRATLKLVLGCPSVNNIKPKWGLMWQSGKMAKWRLCSFEDKGRLPNWEPAWVKVQGGKQSKRGGIRNGCRPGVIDCLRFKIMYSRYFVDSTSVTKQATRP